MFIPLLISVAILSINNHCIINLAEEMSMFVLAISVASKGLF